MSAPTPIDLQRQLVDALAHSAASAAGTPAEVIETHISWVLLLGEYAYKFKKAIDLGFLDYSTLELRLHFCEEELRLNRRTAPGIYLDVVAITGDSEHPMMGGTGQAIEWAVKMRRFDQHLLASWLAEHALLTRQHIDRLAHSLATFHQNIATADPHSQLGSPERVFQPVAENFQQIGALIEATATVTLLAQLQKWYDTAMPSFTPKLVQRKQEGFIRECHGDLHLNNIVVIDDVPLPFDGIEFNDNLRYVDIISEIAFLVMDLDHRQRSDLGWRFLDGYLQESGDFSGLSLLRLYQIYRAMVRGKVDAIRASQTDIAPATKRTLLDEVNAYLQQALDYTHTAPPQLVLTHGFSGSGKTSVSQQLLEQWGAIRLRSDVERKRLFGLGATEASGSKVAEGIYSADASARTYAQLAQLCGLLLDAGFNVIVDATFLRRADRQQFIQLAEARNVRWHLLDVSASETTMRERIVARSIGRHDASEADLAVLAHQLHSHNPFTADENAHGIVVNTDGQWSVEQLLAALI